MKKHLTTALTLIFFPLISLTVFDKIVVPRMHAKWYDNNIQPLSLRFYNVLPIFDEEVEALKPKLRFLNKTRAKDAGPYLNARLPWAAADGSPTYGSKVPLTEQIFLDKDTLEKLSSQKLDFNVLDAREFSHINTKWFRALRDYDYWDIDKNSPLDELPRYSMTAPMPDFMAKLMLVHLLQAVEDGENAFAEALRDVLHYGELALTTETLPGEMVFITALQYANGLTQNSPRVRATLGPWVPLLSEAESLRRVYFSLIPFVRPMFGANPETLATIYKRHSLSSGLCAAIREGLGLDWATWTAFSEVIPEQYTKVRELTTAPVQDCRLTWLKEKSPPWVRLPDEKGFYEDGLPIDMLTIEHNPKLKYLKRPSRVIHYMPNTRRYISAVLMNIAIPKMAQYHGDAESN